MQTIGNDKHGWRIIGPGSGGGHFCPAISPHDSRVALIACDMTGCYITEDSCKSWREFNLGSRSYALAFDPKCDKTIYAGGVALYRSRDLGQTWETLFPRHDKVTELKKLGDHSGYTLVSDDNWPEGGIVRAIYASERDDGVLYTAVSVRSGGYRAPGWVALYRSGDDGASFELLGAVENASDALAIYSDEENKKAVLFTDKGIYVFSTLPGKFMRSLPLPGGAARAISADWGMIDGKPRFYLLTPSHWEGAGVTAGVWASDDLTDWRALDPAIDDLLCAPGAAEPPAYGFVRTSKTNANYVYIAVERYPVEREGYGAGSVIDQYGILKSKDGGEHFAFVLRGDVYRDPDNRENGWVEDCYPGDWYMTGPKGGPALGLGVCSSDPDICYVTDLGAGYRTLDGGESWAQLYCDYQPDGSVSSRGLDVTTTYGVHVDPHDDQHIVISYTDLGMHHSFNGGKSWFHAIRGIPVRWGNTAYWTLFDPDVKGRAWSAWGGRHDLPRPKMYRGGKFYLGQGGVAKSGDSCRSWQLSNEGLPPNSVTTHLLMDPDSAPGQRTLYATVFDKGVYKSQDDGASWELKSNGIKANHNAWWLERAADGTLYLLCARGERRGQYVAGQMYKSTDGAQSWHEVPLPQGVNAPNHLTIDPREPKRMYLGCWPITIDGREHFGGVYRSQDGGETWENCFNPEAHVFGMELSPFDSDTLYINTFDHNAYYSNDRGDTWHRMKGYNFHWGHRVHADPRNEGYVFLTTFGSSVWWGKVEDGDNCWEDVKPYPNLKRLDGIPAK